MFIVLAGGCLLSYFVLGYATNIVAQHLNHEFRKEALHHMLRRDLRFFDRSENTTGALVSRVDSHPQSILELMGYNVGLVLVCVFNILACSILAIAYSWNLDLVVVLGGLPPVASAGYSKIRVDAEMDRDTAKRYSTSASIASEAVAAIRTVSSFLIEETVLKSYVSELDSAVSGCRRPLLTMMLAFAFTQAIEYWFLALGSCVTKGVNAANYISWLQHLQPAVQETGENNDNGPNTGDAVDFVGVRFAYPLRHDVTVLRGIDLKWTYQIKKGQFVALVDASGCGKSTTIALLERFYNPSAGSVNIDGSALTSLNPRAYRRIVGLVQQEPTLFPGSIRENVALGIDSEGRSTAVVSDDQIETALRASNAWDFVCSLPEGLATPARSQGAQLSGGQRQRIAIARALIRDPKILLLDEVTSALDTEGVKIVQAALADAAKQGDRITIAVAHRLSTIKDADLICVFHQVRIQEIGTHQELYTARGMYHKMCEAQSLD
ncbi:P-loop containing nucleoside triphosphate hydrolase protein [Colletotrichum godetiae]|uniref:P-loop containing nucleoside triphosphate hydrolase protein n=1 Tax=Colletotrichum godetiae TaxID=1209918 RepID=A0AAJ0EPN8_9PEZI|nr:P-loop containing nucleoside triphosphate hydrolase protein [Colletotrichum godetiae]KAK1658742.1 P-loop containing nucleoside triphosphate hydrolase protein [Colletotrichum godetiae]